jgi:hypothetical protein
MERASVHAAESHHVPGAAARDVHTTDQRLIVQAVGRTPELTVAVQEETECAIRYHLVVEALDWTELEAHQGQIFDWLRDLGLDKHHRLTKHRENLAEIQDARGRGRFS